MKLLIAVMPLILIIHAGCKNKQKDKYFTGTIEYVYTYSSDSLNIDSIATIRPYKSGFRYDLNSYQSRFISQDTATYYYSGLNNLCIGKANSRENFTCEDYSVVTDSVVSWEIYDTDEKILGQKCQILEIQKINSWVKYHVSTEQRVAPATFEKHKSYNWDFYGEKAEGGLILKSEHRFKYFTMKGVATTVDIKDDSFKALEIKNSLFDEICK